MANSDPRLRYYGRLRTMFRSEAGMHPQTTLTEEDDGDHILQDDVEGATGGADAAFVDGARADAASNPFDSFLVSIY